jgi:hypothetical protein
VARAANLQENIPIIASRYCKQSSVLGWEYFPITIGDGHRSFATGDQEYIPVPGVEFSKWKAQVAVAATLFGNYTLDAASPAVSPAPNVAIEI